MSDPEKESAIQALERKTTAMYAAVGQCLMTWAYVETELSIIFRFCLQSKDDEIAHLVWDSVIAFNAKLKALSAAFYHTIHDEELRSLWDEIHPIVGKKAEKRNEIAHGAVERSIDFDAKEFKVRAIPYWSFRKATDPNKPNLGVPELEERTKSFMELGAALHWFRVRVESLLGPSRVLNVSEPELIVRLRQKIQSRLAREQQRELHDPALLDVSG